MCVASQLTLREDTTSQLTGRNNTALQERTLRQLRNNAKTAHKVRRSRDTDKPVSTQALATGLKTDKFSILRGSQNIPLVYEFTHTHA